MSNKELECVKDVILSNMKTQDIWFDISDGFVETLKEKDKEIDKLTFESTKWESKFYDEAKKADKAIEYLELFNDNCSLIDHSIIKGALNILKGSDKE